MSARPVRTAALKYHQVKIRIEQMMESLSVGDRLPPERQLAPQLGCSVLTVRNALSLLVDEGRLTRWRGRGTFVGGGAPQKPAASSRKPRTLGVLIHTASDAYALRLNETLSQEAEACNATLHVRMVSDLGDGAVRQVSLFAAAGCGAVIVPWILAESDESIRRFVERAELPVSLPLQVAGLESNCFEPAAVFGVNTVRHVDALHDLFAQMGYERVAFLGPDTHHVPNLQRKLSAYAARVGRIDREMLCGLVPRGSAAMDALARRWSEPRGDLAVISYDDDHAFRFMTSMHKLGLSAPEDYVIAGFNNSALAAQTDPGLSSMYQDGRHAARWLLRHSLALAQGRVEQASEPAALHFAVRETCGARAKLGESLDGVLSALGVETMDAATGRSVNTFAG